MCARALKCARACMQAAIPAPPSPFGKAGPAADRTSLAAGAAVDGRRRCLEGAARIRRRPAGTATAGPVGVEPGR